MKLTGFAFGIRTIKSFSTEDKLGAIIDEILYSKESAFNPNLFTEVRGNHNTKVLTDSQDRNKFTITQNDFVFDYNIEKNFDDEYQKYLKSYIEILTKNIFKEYSIRNINRFGFIIKSVLSKKDTFIQEVSKIISKNNGDEDSLSLRFNVINKKPLKIGKEVTQDYYNEIISYDKQNSNSPLNFFVDYQKYFIPELKIIDDAKPNYEDFCNSAMSKFKKTYLETEK
ncbi:MAG: hypothetical protein WCR38_03165 [Bacteroidales bacterium]